MTKKFRFGTSLSMLWFGNILLTAVGDGPNQEMVLNGRRTISRRLTLCKRLGILKQHRNKYPKNVGVFFILLILPMKAKRLDVS